MAVVGLETGGAGANGTDGLCDSFVHDSIVSSIGRHMFLGGSLGRVQKKCKLLAERHG